ncbi:MAG: type II secretion system secretin GspD [Alphaproteobacteria bacterium]
MSQQFVRFMTRCVRVYAVSVVIAAGLAGCETVDEKYGRKHVTVPPSIAGPQATPDATRAALKPDGVWPPAAADRASDALVAPEFYYGSGRVVQEPLGRPGVTADSGANTVSLNFVETGILEVVDVVLGKTLGLNYVIDARVQGTVTARTSKPIPRSAVLSVLENILALNGAAMVESQGVYNIVPVGSVASLPKIVVTPSRHPQSQGVGIHVIPLEFASVASVRDIVASQVSPGHQLAIDHARNILIYTGPAQEARAIAEMVSVLDVDVLAGMSFALFPVQSSNAVDVADELDALFADEAVGSLGSVIRFLPIERLNAILAIASRPAHLKHVGEWVTRLDRSDAAAGERVFVYYAKNSRAKDLVGVLNQIFQGAPSRQDEARQAAVAPGLDPVELIAPARAQPGAGENGESATPGPAPAFVVEPPGAGIRRASGAGGIRIVADEQNNAVVVIATAEQFRMIEATLRRLDILPLQVLIEATIAEVALNDALEYGLQWAFSSGDFSGSSTNNFLGAVAPAFPGFNLVLDTSDVRVVLSALSEVTDVEVVSSPQLMVLDNQTARLQVGDQVPVSTQSSVSSIDPDAPIVNSIDYFDTGVILEVTPRVNASGLVTLDIALDVSDAIPTETSGIDSPTIQQRSIRSIVSVQSGETVALGGLIRERSTESVTGVPILKDIPLLGNLFKTTGLDAQRTELLVLITPRVVRGAAQAREVTEELRRRLTSLHDVVASAQ